MRKFLDKMFASKKLSILLPILLSALLYVLFILFGTAEDKINTVIAAPIVSVLWFFGVFLIVYVQVKNKSCPEGFLNVVEFAATLFFGIYSTVDAISVIIGGFQSFTPITSAGLITYASIAWAHSKRTQ